MHMEGDERKAKASHVGVENYLAEIGAPFTVFHPLYMYGAHTSKDCEQYFLDRIVRDRAVCIPAPGVLLKTFLFQWWWCIFLQQYRIHMDIGNSKNYLGITCVKQSHWQCLWNGVQCHMLHLWRLRQLVTSTSSPEVKAFQDGDVSGSPQEVRQHSQKHSCLSSWISWQLP